MPGHEGEVALGPTSRSGALSLAPTLRDRGDEAPRANHSSGVPGGTGDMQIDSSLSSANVRVIDCGVPSSGR